MQDSRSANKSIKSDVSEEKLKEKQEEFLKTKREKEYL